MNYNYECQFNLKDCIKKLGLEERGKVQQYVTNEILRMSDPYVPMDEGTLKDSGHIENGTDIVWNTPYAHYMWEGIVYVNPELNCAGFKVADGGWRSKHGNKIPSDRSLEYRNGRLRGSKWVDRMLQDGGREKIERGARKKAGE